MNWLKRNKGFALSLGLVIGSLLLGLHGIGQNGSGFIVFWIGIFGVLVLEPV